MVATLYLLCGFSCREAGSFRMAFHKNDSQCYVGTSTMRNRKLTRDKAIQEYLVCQIRINEFLHILHIELDICHGRYKPEIRLRGHYADEFLGTLATVKVGFFASLMDTAPAAINIFGLWLELFPEKKDRILETWQKIKPTVTKVVRLYRHEFAFHANKSFRRHIQMRRRFKGLGCNLGSNERVSKLSH